MLVYRMQMVYIYIRNLHASEEMSMLCQHLQSYVLSVSLELLKFDNFTIKVHHHRDVLFHLTTAGPCCRFLTTCTFYVYRTHKYYLEFQFFHQILSLKVLLKPFHHSNR
jgi:hypothetical protein